MATARFAWAANVAGDNVTAYKIYAGSASGLYDDINSPKNVGNVLTGTFDFTTQGPKFFALTAVNATGESTKSAEITGTYDTIGQGVLQFTGTTPRRVVDFRVRPGAMLRGT